MQKRIIILGAGCGGLWLAHELLSRGMATLLVDTTPYSSYASTRNQSWLHSGALYAISNHERIAQACIEGFAFLQNFCKQYAQGAIEHDSKCLFVFEDKQKREQAAHDLDALKIKAEFLDRSEVENLEPNLRPARLTRYGLSTGDAPFDSYQILKALTGRLFSFGELFSHCHADIKEVDVCSQNGGWSVKAGEKSYEADLVVCSAGVLNPWISEKLFRSRHGMRMQKSLVGVLHQRVCDNIVVVRRFDSDLLNLVPFAGGLSVNFGNSDKEVTDPDDDSVWPDALSRIGRQLTDYVPGLLEIASCQAHFYVCQKLANTNDPSCSHPEVEYGNRHYFWVKQKENFFFYYPGKFTIAPVGARKLAELISESVGRGSSNTPFNVEGHHSLAPPEVAQRPYFHAATHVTDVSRRTLIFKPQH